MAAITAEGSASEEPGSGPGEGGDRTEQTGQDSGGDPDLTGSRGDKHTLGKIRSLRNRHTNFPYQKMALPMAMVAGELII